MRKINLFYLLFFILFSVPVFSQLDIYNRLGISEKDIELLNNRLISLLKNDTLLSSYEDVEFIHTYWFGTEDMPKVLKEEMLNGDFINKIVPTFYTLGKRRKRNNYLKTCGSLLINTHDRSIIARGNAQIFRKYKVLEADVFFRLDAGFVDIAKEKDFVIFFALSWLEPKFALTRDNHWWVIRENSEQKLELITMDYFLDYYYDCWGESWKCKDYEQINDNE